MSIDEFLVLFRELSVGQKKTMCDDEIRIVDSDEFICCPITYVCKRQTGVEYAQHLYSNAAQRLGLTIEDASIIAEASDNVFEEEHLWLRQQLLDVVFEDSSFHYLFY